MGKITKGLLFVMKKRRDPVAATILPAIIRLVEIGERFRPFEEGR